MQMGGGQDARRPLLKYLTGLLALPGNGGGYARVGDGGRGRSKVWLGLASRGVEAKPKGIDFP